AVVASTQHFSLDASAPGVEGNDANARAANVGIAREGRSKVDVRNAVCRAVAAIVPCHRRSEQSRVVDAAGEWPERVERSRQRNDPCQADYIIGGFVPGEAAKIGPYSVSALSHPPDCGFHEPLGI